MAEIGMERKTEHREFWGVSNELIGETTGGRMANLTGLS